MEATESDSNQQNDNRTVVESLKHAEHYMNDVVQTDNAEMTDPGPHAQAQFASTEIRSPAPEAQMEGAATEMKNPAPLESSLSEEVVGALEPSMAPDVDTGSHGTNYVSFSNAEILPENLSAAEDHVTPLLN